MKRFLSLLPLLVAILVLTFAPPLLYRLFVRLWDFLVQIGGANG